MLPVIEFHQPELPLLPDPRPEGPRWFAGGGYVIDSGTRREVHVGGFLVGAFSVEDHAQRNLLLVTLAESPSIHLGQLAEAFRISSETARVLRLQAKREGIQSVARTLRRGGKPKLSDAQRRRVIRLFDEGASAEQVQRKLGGKVSLRTTERVRSEWLEQRRSRSPSPSRGTEAAPEPPEAAVEASAGAEPTDLPSSPVMGEASASTVDEMESTDLGTWSQSASAATESSSAASSTPIAFSSLPLRGSDDAAVSGAIAATGEPSTSTAAREILDDARGNAPTAARSARGVQHLGTWLMMAMLSTWKLHERVAALSDGSAKSIGALRVAVDAVVAALSIGEQCVEGVRRLKTRTAGALLRAQWAPSASWTRGVLHGVSNLAAERILPIVMARDYIAAAQSSTEPTAIFYVDNHVRPYTGDRVVRKGWRMQDKRARPGTTDFYVHDQDGRPLYRVTAPENPSLTALLVPVARDLKELCGDATRPLLCFDRGGAFAQEMAELRDLDVAFVTYERKPYPVVPKSQFNQSLLIDGETVEWVESRINLGKKRGRLRRIALRMPDGHQINLLAAGEVDAPRLIGALGSRWLQENGFKHGVERWGINQLDSRKTEPYAPDTIIPNPARRRLDRAIKAACVREGRARRDLARAAPASVAFEAASAELQASLEQQAQFLSERPTTPTHAPLSETELAAVLVKHVGEYKALLDTIRIACANVESDLAATLGGHLPRPAEAKKALANLLSAPGQIEVTSDRIRVVLEPAGTAPEMDAFAALLAAVNSRGLLLPGDRAARRLEFRLQG